MIFKAFSHMHPLKDKWLRIQHTCNHHLPTQDYDYYKWLVFAFRTHFLRNARKRVIFHYFEEGEKYCIIPLVVYEKKRQLMGMALFGRLDYEDVIANTTDFIFLKTAYKALLEHYPGYTLNYHNVHQDSLLYQVFSPLWVEQEKCVIINLTNDYESFIDGLSKHQRQNIRTAYNKVQKLDFSFSLEEYDSAHPMPIPLWNECERIYEMRHDYRNGMQGHFDRITNPYHYILRTLPNRKIFVLSHDDVPIAYLAGLLNHRGDSLLVPRLCMNNNYYSYSPGILLLCESIKVLISNHILRLDLMLGDEPYKMAMGGVSSVNYSLNTPTNELISICTPQQ